MTVYQNANNQTFAGFGKGSLPVTDANGKIYNLPASSDGNMLVLDSTQAQGIKWTAQPPAYSNTVGNGATGNTSFTAGTFLLGNGTSPLLAYSFAAPSDNSVIYSTNATAKTFSFQAKAPGLTQFALYSAQTAGTAVQNGTHLIIDTDATGSNAIPFTYLSSNPNRRIEISGDGVHNWKLTQTVSGQQCYVGNVQTTSGTSGYIASTSPSDSIELIAISATAWVAHIKQGNVTVN